MDWVIFCQALVDGEATRGAHTALGVEGYRCRSCATTGDSSKGELRLRGDRVGRGLRVLIDLEAIEATDTTIFVIEVVLTREVLAHSQEILDVVRAEDQDAILLGGLPLVKGLLQ